MGPRRCGKIAVISSALYGTVSGSTVANVYATGSFTIPLMKRSGYTPKQSAAIETVAGIGGQIMPPIMGAGSFIMSEVTGVPYFTIIKVAVIPAILYYLGVFCMVHFIALKRGFGRLIGPSGRPSAASCVTPIFFCRSWRWWGCWPTAIRPPRRRFTPSG